MVNAHDGRGKLSELAALTGGLDVLHQSYLMSGYEHIYTKRVIATPLNHHDYAYFVTGSGDDWGIQRQLEVIQQLTGQQATLKQQSGSLGSYELMNECRISIPDFQFEGR